MKSKDKLWEYLYKHRFSSKVEGYKSIQIRLQRQLQTEEVLFSISCGSQFVCLNEADLPTIILELITLQTKLRDLLETKQEF